MPRIRKSDHTCPKCESDTFGLVCGGCQILICSCEPCQDCQRNRQDDAYEEREKDRQEQEAALEVERLADQEERRRYGIW